jgi:hypothetical protein
MQKRGYIILIVGVALLISGTVILASWAGSFAGTIISENTILSGVSIRPAALVNTTIQVIDTSRPVSLAIQVERNNGTSTTTTTGGGGGQISNNTLRETVRDPNGVIMTSNEFKAIFYYV